MKFDLDEQMVSELLLDPNNYRFLDLSLWRRRLIGRYHDASVQELTIQLLEKTARYKLNELRESILANGYIPLERIVVIPYDPDPKYHIVVEGNRRVAALKILLRDHEGGALTLSESQIKNFSKIPVAILIAEEEGLLAAERTLMGLRHIAGPQQWGAYQQAYLILELVRDEGQQLEDISRHLGISRIESGRRYRAIRALGVMEHDDLYSGVAKADFYHLFHELVSLPSVREFFGWNHDEAAFSNLDKARRFFELIAPLEQETPAKLRTYRDVRDLRYVVGNRLAEDLLLDQDQPLAAALVAARPDLGLSETADLAESIRKFFKGLEETRIEALLGLTEDSIVLLHQTSELITSRLEQFEKLNT